MRASHGEYSIEIYDVLASSNDKALSLAHADRHVIVAQVQTKGRGRYGRIWHSLPGNLHASIVLVYGSDFLAPIRLVAAVIKTINKLINANVQYKWPNDVMIDGKKVCGILPESSTHGLVIGLGLNVLSAPEDATCLGSFCNNAEHMKILFDILDAFTEENDIYARLGHYVLHNYLNSCLYNNNILTNFRIGDDVRSGIIRGLDSNFGIFIEDSGKKQSINLGEII